MRPSHDCSGDICTRFRDWVEQFYEANTDPLFRQAVREFGKELVSGGLIKLALSVAQKTEEQFSSQEIGQFLAAVEEVRGYDEVQQFCVQIEECHRLWSILTDWGRNQCRQQFRGVCEGKPVGTGENSRMDDGVAEFGSL